MLLYKITGSPMTLDEGFDEKLESSPRERNRFAANIRAASGRFNERYVGAGIYMFCVDICEESAVIDAICRDPLPRETVHDFMKETNLLLHRTECGEILFGEFLDDLNVSSGNRFISRNDDILERFGLEELVARGYQKMLVCENLLEDKTKNELLAVCQKRLASESFAPEIERIALGAKNKAVAGHPVHYIFNYRGREAERALTRILLEALYAAGRIRSRRYTCVNIPSGESFAPGFYDALCRSMTGGSLVVRFEADDRSFDSDRADGMLDAVEKVCNFLHRYRNSVLTVLCLPRGAGRLKSVLYNMLGNVAVVELEEDLSDAERSVRYLKARARAAKVYPDKALTSTVAPEEHYLPDELDGIFEKWYDKKLRTSVYPQYAEAKTGNREVQKEKPKGNAYEELTAMIGLDEAKAVIQKALDHHKFGKLYGELLGEHERPSMHMVFTGSPGTAKTTVARLLARIFKDNGLLSTGVMVEVGRSDLVGKYVGWTAKIVKEKFAKAKGGVLFIDEAYSLVDDRDGSFGDEAINTIVQEMENMREDVVVIFAGYADKMERFLQKNPGLRSRIAWHVPFPDYTAEELTEISDLIAAKKGLRVTPEARARIFEAADRARATGDFGNGRYIRNLMEKARMNMTSRIVRCDPEKVDRAMLTTILPEDIELPAAPSVRPQRRIGFET